MADEVKMLIKTEEECKELMKIIAEDKSITYIDVQSPIEFRLKGSKDNIKIGQNLIHTSELENNTYLFYDLLNALRIVRGLYIRVLSNCSTRSI